MPILFAPHKNLVTTSVLTAPSPATTGTTLVLASGTGSAFPSPSTHNYSVVVYPSNTFPNQLNSEIVTVTALSGDTMTIVRGAESSTARAIVAGDNVSLVITAKTLTDIEDAINTVQTSIGNLDASVITTGVLNSTHLPALGGDVSSLAGSNNVSLAAVNSNIGSFGDSHHIAAVTVNAKGLVTAVSSVATAALTGDVTSSAGSSVTTLATVNGNPGTFGNATHVPIVTVNAKGLVTSVSTATITGGGGFPDITDNSVDHLVGFNQTNPQYTIDVNGTIGNSFYGNTNFLTLDDGSANTTLTSQGLVVLTSGGNSHINAGGSLVASNGGGAALTLGVELDGAISLVSGSGLSEGADIDIGIGSGSTGSITLSVNNSQVVIGDDYFEVDNAGNVLFDTPTVTFGTECTIADNGIPNTNFIQLSDLDGNAIFSSLGNISITSSTGGIDLSGSYVDLAGSNVDLAGSNVVTIASADVFQLSASRGEITIPELTSFSDSFSIIGHDGHVVTPGSGYYYTDTGTVTIRGGGYPTDGYAFTEYASLGGSITLHGDFVAGGPAGGSVDIVGSYPSGNVNILSGGTGVPNGYGDTHQGNINLATSGESVTSALTFSVNETTMLVADSTGLSIATGQSPYYKLDVMQIGCSSFANENNIMLDDSTGHMWISTAAALKINGVATLTTTQTFKDGSGVTKTMHINNGLITSIT